jgi:hypothetical protein
VDAGAIANGLEPAKIREAVFLARVKAVAAWRASLPKQDAE